MFSHSQETASIRRIVEACSRENASHSDRSVFKASCHKVSQTKIKSEGQERSHCLICSNVTQRKRAPSDLLASYFGPFRTQACFSADRECSATPSMKREGEREDEFGRSDLPAHDLVLKRALWHIRSSVRRGGEKYEQNVTYHKRHRSAPSGIIHSRSNVFPQTLDGCSSPLVDRPPSCQVRALLQPA